MRGARRAACICAILAVLPLAVMWTYRQVAPPRHWTRLLTDFTRDHGMRASPAGTCWVRLVVEEVGAQRSGNPYLWVSSYSVLNGYQVLCEGFIDAEGYEADQRPPVRWVGERELEVIFAAAKRRGSPPVVTRCQAP